MSDDVEEIDVPVVPEPDVPEDGLIDPADNYGEGALPHRVSEGHGRLPEIPSNAYGPDSTPLSEVGE